MTAYILAVVGFLLGAFVARRRTWTVWETESEAITRLRRLFVDQIADATKRLLEDSCGVTEADTLRAKIRDRTRLISLLPIPLNGASHDDV